jgi:hypothetical protein
MILTKAILLEAEKWLGCKETSHNRSACVDEIQKLYNNKINAEAWCCKFVYAMTNEACKKLGVENPLVQTASTATLLKQAKQVLRTDGTAGVGSIFYTTRTGGGHVGFVTDVDGSKFETIEGNTTSDTGNTDGVWRKTRDVTTKEYQFIHLEDLDTFENNLFAPLQFEVDMIIADPRSYISAGILVTAGIIAWRIFKK